MTKTIIAFIPGTTASELVNPNGKTIWPNLIGEGKIKLAEWADQLLLYKEKITVGNLVSTYPNPLDPTQPIPCYQSLMDYMGTSSHFGSNVNFTLYTYNSASATAKVPVADYLFYMIPYDWRQENGPGDGSNSTWVNAALTQLDASYAQEDYQLFIMAHSMGGLISRYLLEVTPNKGPWVSKLQALITLGTPHYGAPLALPAILGDAIAGKEIPWSQKLLVGGYVQKLINNPHYPSTYELLPPQGVAFLTDEKTGASLDLYAPSDALAKALSRAGVLGVAHFDAKTLAGVQKDFFGAMPYQGPFSVPYHCLVGTQEETVTSVTYTPGNLVHKADFVGLPVKGSGGGDGVVPQTSASFQPPSGTANKGVTVYEFANYDHGQLAGSNMTTQPAAIETALFQIIGIPKP